MQTSAKGKAIKDALVNGGEQPAGSYWVTRPSINVQ